MVPPPQQWNNNQKLNYNQLLMIQQHQHQRQHNLHFFQRQLQLQLQQQHQRQQYLFFKQEHQLQQNLLAAENVGTANLNNVVSDDEVNYSTDALFTIGGGNYNEHNGGYIFLRNECIRHSLEYESIPNRGIESYKKSKIVDKIYSTIYPSKIVVF
jgi:hypothetical protein